MEWYLVGIVTGIAMSVAVWATVTGVRDADATLPFDGLSEPRSSVRRVAAPPADWEAEGWA